MHALSLFVGVLKGHALPAQSRQLVDSISRAVQALGGLFDGLLNLSRLDAGVVRPQVQPVAIADVLDRLQHEFSRRRRQNRCACACGRSRPRSRRTRRCWTASCAT